MKSDDPSKFVVNPQFFVFILIFTSFKIKCISQTLVAEGWSAFLYYLDLFFQNCVIFFGIKSPFISTYFFLCVRRSGDPISLAQPIYFGSPQGNISEKKPLGAQGPGSIACPSGQKEACSKV